jgi:GNAT superfamily N-acetyltransferase
METRPATQADVPGLEVIRRQAIESGFTDEYDRSAFAHLVATPEERLEAWITSSAYEVLVGETEVTAVCFGVFDRESGEIIGLYTAPNHERKGCATALLAAFEATAREDGIDQITVDAPLNAVDFFEDRGFERRGTVERDDVPADLALERVRFVKPVSTAADP